MPLRRTPLLPSGLRAEPPELRQHRSQHWCGSGGRRGGDAACRGGRICGAADRILSAAAFSAGFYRSAASPIEEDWRLLPPPIARAVLPVTVSAGFAGCLRVRA